MDESCRRPDQSEKRPARQGRFADCVSWVTGREKRQPDAYSNLLALSSRRTRALDRLDYLGNQGVAATLRQANPLQKPWCRNPYYMMDK